MPTRRITVHHFFDGGWATDIGPTVKAVPDQAGNILIPHLLKAEDLLFELNGGLHKSPGTAKVNSSALESGSDIKAIYDYWIQGTAGSATQKRVVFVGTHVYKDNADGSFTSIKSGLQSNAVPHMSQFDDLLILANDNSSDVPMSYDGTTFQDLAGSPPNFSFSVKHKNFHFAAGVDANPSTLYYSVSIDPEDWTGAGSGSIQIDPDDGDRITAIASFRNELWVFKGPNKGSIHRITGTSGSDWARTTFTEGVGAVWQNSVTHIQDDLAFLWTDGTVRTLKSTEQFGDYSLAALSTPIQGFLLDALNFNQLRHAFLTAGPDGNRMYLSIPVEGSSKNNTTLVCDVRFNPVRWSRLVSYDEISTAVGLDPTNSGRPVLYIGGSDGFLRVFGQSQRAIDGSGAISFDAVTPHFDYGTPQMIKTLAAVGLGIHPKNDGTLTFGWQRDDDNQQTGSITQGGEDVLGTASANQFTLGTSALGGSRYVNRFLDTETGGEFRSIGYEITNSTASEDVEIQSIISIIEPGPEATEN